MTKDRLRKLVETWKPPVALQILMAEYWPKGHPTTDVVCWFGYGSGMDRDYRSLRDCGPFAEIRVVLAVAGTGEPAGGMTMPFTERFLSDVDDVFIKAWIHGELDAFVKHSWIDRDASTQTGGVEASYYRTPPVDPSSSDLPSDFA